MAVDTDYELVREKLVGQPESCAMRCDGMCAVLVRGRCAGSAQPTNTCKARALRTNVNLIRIQTRSRRVSWWYYWAIGFFRRLIVIIDH